MNGTANVPSNSAAVGEKRRRGRPPLPPEAKPVGVYVRLAPAVYDHYCREAIQTGVGVSAVLRRELVRGITRTKKTREA